MMSFAVTESDYSNTIIEGDFLNRQSFIFQVKNVIETLSENKKNSCFAISGTWGIGKSYVLDKLEKQLLFEQDEKTTSDKFFVFHFNCWEYDYYEEPLIAIVASMLDEVTTKKDIFSESAKSHIISASKHVFRKVYSGFSNWLESKTGLDLKGITDELSEIRSDAQEMVEDSYKFDKYFDFKQALAILQEELKKISCERTVIFVVDELDRCIPEYQIKVLERLHHIFDRIDNMQVVLAVDKNQLERTVQKMFGENVDTQKYLAKFIKFEIELDEGVYNSQFEEIHDYYFKQFHNMEDSDIAEFITNVFNGIAAREKIEIVEKCNLIHSLINKTGEKMHARFMCVELFLTIVKHTKAQLPARNNVIAFNNMFGKNPVLGLAFLQSKMSHKYKEQYDGEQYAYYSSFSSERYIRPCNLWGVLLGCYAIVAECKIDGYLNSNGTMESVEEYTKQFWTILKTIK